MKHRSRIALAAAAIACCAAPAWAGWKGPTMYMGAPELRLTAEVVAAGGGPTRFDSKQLVAHMAGANAPAALAYLTRTYGAANVAAFFRTFTYAVDDSLRYATAKGIALPAATVPSGHTLTEQLYAAGTLPSGAYDPGYMLEHLVSHPIHMWVMWDINRQPDLGKKTDETFHIILTDAMRKLTNH